jgi:Protein of Unknown function (DUF2784)
LAYQVLADAVLLVHASFAIFVVTGGFLALRWRRLVWLHLPAAIWGAAVEFNGWLCPLTPLENSLREMAGQAAYEGDFINHYLEGALYPASLTHTLQIGLGTFAVVVNAVAYALIVRRHARHAKISR